MYRSSFSPSVPTVGGKRKSGAQTGIVAGTRVATAVGWRAIEELKAGDQVLTFDGGMQPIVSVERTAIWPRGNGDDTRRWPLIVPAGAMGNQSEMTLLPDQPVMLESDAAEDIFGDPFTLMKAEALEGFRGIRRLPPSIMTEVVTLRFDQEQVVFANIGALFLCPCAVSGDDGGGRSAAQAVYDLLPTERAMDLTEMIARSERVNA